MSCTCRSARVRRLLRRYRADDAAGLVHGNHGRRPAHRIDDQLRARVVELATTTYAGVNHSHLAELLAEREDLDVAQRTLRRILAEASVRPVRPRRPPRHRSRRNRMPRRGSCSRSTAAATTGSRAGARRRVRHPGGRHRRRDRAGARRTFRAQDDAVGYFTTLAQTADHHGLPGAVYAEITHDVLPRRTNRPKHRLNTSCDPRSQRIRSVGRGCAGVNPGAAHFVWAHVASADCQDPSRRNPCPDTRQLRAVCSGVHNGGHPGRRSGAAVHGAAIRPGGRGPTACAPRPCCAATIGAGSVETARSAGRALDLELPRRPDGRSWSRRSVILRERLDGSLWVSHDGLCVALAPAQPIQASSVPGGCRARRRIDLRSTSACSLRLHRPSGGPPGRPPITPGTGATLDADSPDLGRAEWRPVSRGPGSGRRSARHPASVRGRGGPRGRPSGRSRRRAPR